MSWTNITQIPISAELSVWLRVNRLRVTIAVPDKRHPDLPPTIIKIKFSEWKKVITRYRAETPSGGKVMAVKIKAVKWFCAVNGVRI